MIRFWGYIIMCGLFVTSSDGSSEKLNDVADELKTVSNRDAPIVESLLNMRLAESHLHEQSVSSETNGLSDVDRELLRRVNRQTEPDEVAFSAELGTRLDNIPAGKTVVFDNRVYGTDYSYDESTGVFTCPTTGLYLFSVFVESAINREAFVVLKVDGIMRTSAVSEPGETGEDDSGGNMILARVTKGSRVWIETYKDENQSLWPSFTTFHGVLIHRERT